MTRRIHGRQRGTPTTPPTGSTHPQTPRIETVPQL
jgi:hypothetical protein